MPEGWPLTGRVEELRLLGGLRRAGGSAGVVLAGAAGVGKTRLAREALATAARRGVPVRWAAATASARALPLGAFAGIVAKVGADPLQLLHNAGEALLAGGGPGGVVVGVDDGHLLDDLSAMLVHQLATSRAATLVITLRTGEPVPDAVTALWKDGHLTRLELQPLSEQETGELLEAALGGPVDTGAARRLWLITRGNALYLRQLVDGELMAGRLGPVGGLWRWSGQPRLSPGLTELVQERIGALSDAEREVVEVLAFGEPLGVETLTRLTDAAAVERAEARGLVEVAADGQRRLARLAHPLYGEVQRARCGPLRARRLRGRVAQALADSGARRADDVLRRAVLAVDSDLEPDPALLTEAAGRAVTLLDFVLAARLGRAAIAAGGGYEARLLLGYALSWGGRGDEAEAELAVLAGLVDGDEQRVQATVPRVGNLFWTLARPDEALAVLSAALEAVGDGAPALALAGMRSVTDGWLGRTTEAATAARSVLADPRCSGQAATFARWGLITAAGGIGRLDAAAAEEQRSRRLTEPSTTAHVRTGMGAMWLRAQCLAGLFDAAEATARHYGGPVVDSPPSARFLMEALHGEVALHRGLVGTAIRELREALIGMRGADPGGWTYHLTLMLTAALAMAGDPAARASLVETEQARHPSFVFMEPDLHLARAWVAAAEGSVSEALALAGRAAELAASQSQPAMEVVALHTAVCFGDRTVAARLAAVAPQVDGPRAAAAAAHAAALGADDAVALLVAADGLERMGALLLAADAAAQAAVVHDRHGRRGSSRIAAARAIRLAESCDGARTPALRAMTQPLPLTAREREIVMLAASGLPNRLIAQRLVVSVRTVEGHLYRACRKLGVNDRAELSSVVATRSE